MGKKLLERIIQSGTYKERTNAVSYTHLDVYKRQVNIVNTIILIIIIYYYYHYDII